MSITDLPARIAALTEERRARFQRLFDVDVAQGECVLPAEMQAWVAQRFGNLRDVEQQHIVRVTNRVTWQGALYNPLRARRPTLKRTSLATATMVDLFTDPLHHTSADPFGRVRGQHCITASNIARWDGLCSVLIFDEPDPFAFTRAHLRDYFRTALAWAAQAHAAHSEARYLLWSWNGGAAGGATIPHAHAQLGLGARYHYAQVEGLRRAALSYRQQHGANYFDDLYAAHDDVGLGVVVNDVRGFVSLAAIRPKDTWLLGRALDAALADALHDVLRAYIEHGGMRGFNVAVWMPPLFEDPPHTDEDWSGFPVIARVVDRGHPDAASSDMGAMDLFAQCVIADDPYADFGFLIGDFGLPIAD
jgi:hypothetical protein